MDFRLGTNHDVVTAFEVLENLPQHPGSFLAGLNDALRVGGRLVLTTPNITSWTAIDRLYMGVTPYETNQFGDHLSHRKEYTPWEVKWLLESAGFRVDKIKTFNAYF